MYIRLDECIRYDERYNKQSTEYEKHFYGISYKKHFWNKWKKLNIPNNDNSYNDNSFENVILIYNLLIELYDINGWKQSKHISKRTYNEYIFNNSNLNGKNKECNKECSQCCY